MTRLRLQHVFAMALLALVPLISPASAEMQVLNLPGYGDYEIYSTGGGATAAAPQTLQGSKLLRESPRHAMNEDGMIGFFVSETADRLEPKRLFTSFRYDYRELTSRYGKAFLHPDTGSIGTLQLAANWLGDWAEWTVMVPMQKYDLSAPRTFNKAAEEGEGIGDIKLGWKATYLPDKSYYRFAYGAVVEASTGDTDAMRPAGSEHSDEIKLFGCVTTKETDSATANLELGAIVDSQNIDTRFIYRIGMSYEPTAHAALIGEFAGEVQGGQDKDTLDMIMGIRLAPSPKGVLELAYSKNLRTYREFGWDDRLQIGATIRW